MTISGATYREGIAFSPDGAMYVTPTGSASITGGTITGITDLAVADGGTGGSTGLEAARNLSHPYVVAKSSIPFIWLSSGSVAANGAISGITALPRAYPRAYCYFPANILATVSAAGWYYCTFSTTTAGVAFLDSYTSGIPTVPASPAAVSDGKGAFTSVTAETAGQTIAMPALAANDAFTIDMDIECPNNANAKTIKARYGSTDFATVTVTSTVGARSAVEIANTGNTATQLGSAMGGVFSSGSGVLVTLPNLGTEASSGVLNVQLRGTHATATDNLIVTRWRITLLSNGS